MSIPYCNIDKEDVSISFDTSYFVDPCEEKYEPKVKRKKEETLKQKNKYLDHPISEKECLKFRCWAIMVQWTTSTLLVKRYPIHI
jgi:hypothetical protein